MTCWGEQEGEGASPGLGGGGFAPRVAVAAKLLSSPNPTDSRDVSDPSPFCPALMVPWHSSALSNNGDGPRQQGRDPAPPSPLTAPGQAVPSPCSGAEQLRRAQHPPGAGWGLPRARPARRCHPPGASCAAFLLSQLSFKADVVQGKKKIIKKIMIMAEKSIPEWPGSVTNPCCLCSPCESKKSRGGFPGVGSQPGLGAEHKGRAVGAVGLRLAFRKPEK